MSSAFNLRDLGARLVTFLGKPERLALRAACREGRVVVDRDTSTLGPTHLDSWYWDGRFAAFVNGMLSRGSRPLRLALYGGDARAVLALFVQHQQKVPQQQHGTLAAPSLTYLYLHDIPFTHALVSAVRSAAPHLTSLELALGRDLGRDLHRLQEATPGLCHLITTCAPSLTFLAFTHDSLTFVPQPLADAITACTRLQHLELCLVSDFWHHESTSSDEEDPDDTPSHTIENKLAVRMARMAEAIRALPSLRSLGLQLYGELEEDLAVEAALGSLTQLTSLTLEVYGSLPALWQLHNLVRLTVSFTVVYKLEDVQHLSQLTYLRLDSGGKEYFIGRLDNYDCSELPASLRELHLEVNLTPRQLLQLLQLVPGLTRLSFAGIEIPVDEEVTPPAAAAGGAGGAPPASRRASLDGAGAGVPPAANGEQAGGMDDRGRDWSSDSGAEDSADVDSGGAMEDGDAMGGGGASDSYGVSDGAVEPDGGMSGRASCSGSDEAEETGQAGGDELLEAVGLLHGRYDGSKGLTLILKDDGSPGGWSLGAGNGHVRLFAALKPLRLRKLVLRYWALEVADVAALVEQLQELEELDLTCEVHPEAVPLLAGLPRLRSLRVCLLPVPDEAEWTAASLATALMAVVLYAPGLQQVRIDPGYTGNLKAFQRLQAVVEAGVERIQQRLRQMGRKPELVKLPSW